MESLRRIGDVSKSFESAEAADEWRAAMRRACRAEHLRVRTRIFDADDGTLLAIAVDLDRNHVATDAWISAAVNALPTPATRQRVDNAEDGRLRGDRQHRAEQRVFMEITRRDDVGADLNAPVEARGGVATASYRLVPLVRPR